MVFAKNAAMATALQVTDALYARPLWRGITNVVIDSVLIIALLTVAPSPSVQCAEVAGIAVSGGVDRLHDRRKLPEESEYREAASRVEAAFSDRIENAKQPSQKLAVAHEVFDARVTVTQAAELYAILNLAMKMGSQVGDAALMIQAADEISTVFEVDSYSLVARSLTVSATPQPPESWAAVRGRLPALIGEAIAADDLVAAEALLQGYAGLALRARDSEAATHARQLQKAANAKLLRRKELAVLLEQIQKPDCSQKTFTKLGKLLCFGQQKWQQGIEILVKGDDQSLAKAAAAEINAVNAEAMLAAAEAWVTAAETVPGSESQCVKEHALMLLEKASETASG